MINSKAICAVITANLGLRAGLFPHLFVAALWGGSVLFSPLPGDYAAISILCLFMFGGMEGVGFRLTCAAPRAYLVPGLREYNRIIRFTVLLALSCAVAAGSGKPETVPAFLAILWFGALAGFYGAGVSRHPLAAVFAGGLLTGGLAAGLGSDLRQHREIIGLDPRWAVLLFLEVLHTIWIWRRIGTERDLTWIRPGTGAFWSSLEARSRKKRSGSSRELRPSPASVQNAVRFLSFNPGSLAGGAMWRRNLASILFWSCIVSFRFRDAATDWSGPAFQLALAVPIIEGCFLSASAVMSPVLFVAAIALSLGWTEPRTVAGTLLLSLPLGPLLIWLAYRRWLNTEIGTWASVSPKS